MNAKNKVSVLFCGLLMCVIALPARAQENNNNGSTASPGQVREEVRDLIRDLNDPNYDYSKVPDRMRQVFQDFRAATDGMDQETAQTFRQDLFTQLMPVIMANQEKIRQAVQDEYLKRLQQPMGCSDEEFAAIRPYLEKVVDAFAASQVNRFRPPRNGTQGQTNGNNNNNNDNNRSNQFRRPPSNVPVSAVQQAADDLEDALNDPSSASDLIKNKLDSLRQARDKAKQDLMIARSQLQALLTQRQEAVLVEYGLLD
jgi:hypothetical protein